MAKPKQTSSKGKRRPPRRGKRPYTVSPAVRAANLRNSQMARGKNSPQGLKASSMNALKHARFAASSVLPGEDERAHREKIEFYQELLGSESLLEIDIAKIAAKSVWTWARVPGCQPRPTPRPDAQGGKEASPRARAGDRGPGRRVAAAVGGSGRGASPECWWMFVPL